MAFFNAHIVFILKAGANQYLTGVTNDIDEVVARQPGFQLVYQQHFDDEKTAFSFEQKVKGLDSARKEALIQGESGM